MSHESHFRINVTEDCDLEAVRQVIAEISTEKSDDYDLFVLYGPENAKTDIRTDEDMRWQRWVEDMTKVSQLLPHLTFAVIREGDTYERGVFRNGSSKVVNGAITYPDITVMDLALPDTQNLVQPWYFAAYVRNQEGVVIIRCHKGKDRATQYFHTEYGKRNLVGYIGVPTRELFAAYELQGHDIENIE